MWFNHLNYMFVSVAEKYKKALPELAKSLGKKNKLAAPRLVKVVINVGTGRQRDKNRQQLVADRLGRITGQKPSARQAKKSVATFKLRQGEVIGHSVTLRGQRMYDFLDKLINIATPRTRDFRGFNDKAIDEIGNVTIGIKEHIIFPETADEELRDVFGLSVTVVTTAKSREEAKALLDTIGFPFKK